MWEDEVRIPPPGYRSAPQRRAAEARRMMMAVGGVGAVLLLCVGGYYAATGGGSAGVPIIQPQPGPIKVKPADPGGLQVSAQTSALLGGDGSGANANLAPAPEAPDPAALAAAANQEQSAATAPTPAPMAAVPPPPPPAPAPAPAVSVPSVPETAAMTAPEKTAMNIPPPSPGAAAVHNLAEEYTPPVASAQHGRVHVQFAALGSQQAAFHEWDRLSHRMPGLFDGRRPIFAEAHVNGHTYWRVRTAGFASVAEASRFCGDVRARGAACTVALF
jgi:SPOR domain